MRRLAWALLAVLAAGCPLGPDYHRPDVPQVEHFRGQPEPPQERSLGDLPFWEVFGDPVLQQLLREAVARSWSVQQAVARVEQARVLARASGWALFPTLGAQLGAQRQSTVILPPTRRTFSLFTAQANVAWELDVWGRLRRAQEAAYAQYAASEEARRAVLSALVADVAQTYFQLRALDAQLDILQRRHAVRVSSLAIFQARLEGGTGNAAEVANARALVLQVEAEQANLLRQRVQTENALSVLLARTPGEVARGLPLQAQALPPEVPAGLPSQLLERRPDVRLAEEQLVAANAQVGVALAQLFPRLSLTGALGIVSPQLAQALESGPAWSYGVSAPWALPFLGGDALRANHEAAQARLTEALAAYQQTVLVALREVSDALVAREQLSRQVMLLEQQVAAVEEQRQLAEDRYRGGVANYLEVTTAEESLLPAQLLLVQARANQLDAVVQLYRALGGGWQEPAPQAADGGVPAMDGGAPGR